MFGLFGIALAILAIVVGHLLGGGELTRLINPPSAVIVFGGTLAAGLIQAPRQDFARAWRLVLDTFRAPPPDLPGGLQQVRDWCLLARRKGLVALEYEVGRLHDRFVANGLQLLADGRAPEMIRQVLEVELITSERHDLQAVRLLESLAGYAPTLGIIGTVLGLMQVMANLAEPELLGSGIATAFVSTVYGVALANLFLIPTANKIKRGIQARSQYREMIMDGLLYIAEGQGPEVIRQRLEGYLEGQHAASKAR